ncbi:hypothetical protein FQA39_LY06305 [Lamprigera yunnana]|nr:hypothetical protein FQA39_LY06305 [Lamprigera yunnana]
MNEFETQYDQNGIIYKIIGNAELLYNLQNYSLFATGYIAEYENSLEIASVLQDDEHTTRHKEATTNNENVPPLNNNKKTKTRHGHVPSGDYDRLQDIFVDDRTINPEHTLSSIVKEEIHHSPRPLTNDFKQTLTSTLPDELTKQPEITPANLDLLVLPTTSTASTSASSHPVLHSPQTRLPNIESYKGKRLQEYREKLLEIEERRLEEIRQLTESIQCSNEIQKERNDILRHLLCLINSNIRHDVFDVPIVWFNF